MKKDSYLKANFYLLLFICIIASGVILKLAAKIIVPVMFAILLSLVMLPVLQKLKKSLHIPWIVSAIAILGISLSLIFTIGNMLVSSLSTIVTLYPRYENRLMAIYQIFAKAFKLPFNETNSLFENLWNQLGVRGAVQSALIAITSGTINTGKTLFTIMLLILFLVSEMNSFQDKLSYAFSTQKVKGRVSKALNNIIQEVTQFISIKFIISLATGIIIGTGTFLTGLEFPVVWGFLAFILNFIPTFGSIISSLFTIVFSIIQFYPDISSIVIVTLIIAITQFTLGNILEPRITGSNLGLSPFMILVSLSIWGGIWGFSGFLLAVPTTVIVKIICENVSFLHPIAIFLGNVPGETKKQLSPVDESDTTEETEGSDTTI
ncbi:MAG: AI-2E family transporter [Treponema sp.]|uniref:AI-2E family transporter n=1 Tax=Treponema sp. TaxID=166 RepID=UPI001D90DC84|nr:AI-2E family transporter [Treponema sp.]MCI6258051.1 AI-2E family transporter [Spirochaetia bacterium]MBS7311199.1 AI-2E family transporter [Treponema sp.]MDD6294565.1 AI-2E family transporter [Treponema sp.]MDY2924205.1 AI-2E family transporter [Treponema sp.]MDY5683623.1 AI-2E family transporter [Treponema sp.]